MFAKLLNHALIGLCLLTAGRPAISAPADDFEFFEKRIRPVLVDRCYPCHSAGAEKIKGGLRLDSQAGLLKGGDNGPALTPGAPETSRLIQAVRYTDPDLQMPPKGKRLTDGQIADLAAWVKMGAPDPRTDTVATAGATPAPAAYDFIAARKQWAFQKPNDPTPPKVKNQRWAKSVIDRFILAQLEAKKLAPAPPADKRALLRRATFDLIGLPPTPAEMADFLADNSTDAFARVVDRLLASPHYGERWARHWLDVVRYTDSTDARSLGSEADVTEAYRYRDWVVNAFNQDLPYDQFVREQIAGDLLQPKAPDRIDTNGIIATGVYAIGNWGNGDADKDKILTDIADDQVDLTGRTFLGLTLACARCHDHKFDPIPTADYYSLAGIFFSSHILPKLTPKGQGENLLFLPLASPAELERRAKREARIAELEKQIKTTGGEQLAALAKTLPVQTADYLAAVAAYQNLPSEQAKMDLAKFCADWPGSFHPAPALLRQWLDYLGFSDAKLLSRITHDFNGKTGLHTLHNSANADTPSGVINATDQEAAFSTIKMPPRSVAIHPSPMAGVAAAWKSPITGTLGITGRVADADPNCGDGIEWRIEVQREPGTTEIASGAIPNGGAQSFADGKGAEGLKSVAIKTGDIIRLVVLPKAEYSCDTTVVEMELSDPAHPKQIWSLTGDLLAGANEGRNPYPDRQGHADVWSLLDLQGQSPMDKPDKNSPLTKWLAAVKSRAAASEVAALAQEVQRGLLAADAAKSPVARLDADLVNPQSAFWSGTEMLEVCFPAAAQKSLASDRSELTGLKQNPPPPLARANGIAEGGVPESPHAGTHDVRVHLRGRYDHLGELAPRRFPRLLAGDEQPAIAQGSGRRQLADWIASADNPLTARVMVNRIWQHHFGEGLVRTPNNFGKLGTPPTHPELLDYLAHRFVESGWSVKAMHRAIMLSAAYQQSSVPVPATFKADPDNLLFGRMNRHRLESEALRDSLLVAAGKLDPALGGPAIRDWNTFRRTLYVMTIRSDRTTYQFLFDAADPGTIAEKRMDSTVAPQAMFLLNNPFVITQTSALASRLAKEAPADDTGRIAWLYQLLYARPADRQEIELGLRALSRRRSSAAEPEAAWRDYCQALVCANEFIYVD